MADKLVLKLCRYPGCFNLARDDAPYCDAHFVQDFDASLLIPQKQGWQNASRPNAELYNTTRWRKLRAMVIKEHPYCMLCGTESDLTVHHILPPKGDANLFFDESNLIVICKRCHNGITAREVKR